MATLSAAEISLLVERVVWKSGEDIAPAKWGLRSIWLLKSTVFTTAPEVLVFVRTSVELQLNMFMLYYPTDTPDLAAYPNLELYFSDFDMTSRLSWVTG